MIPFHLCRPDDVIPSRRGDRANCLTPGAPLRRGFRRNPDIYFPHPGVVLGFPIFGVHTMGIFMILNILPRFYRKCDRVRDVRFRAVYHTSQMIIWFMRRHLLAKALYVDTFFIHMQRYRFWPGLLFLDVDWLGLVCRRNPDHVPRFGTMFARTAKSPLRWCFCPVTACQCWGPSHWDLWRHNSKIS